MRPTRLTSRAIVTMALALASCRPASEPVVRIHVDEKCPPEEAGARIVQSSPGGVLVRVRDRLEVWPVGSGRWVLPVDDGEVAAIGPSTVVVAKLSASSAAWHTRIRWMDIHGVGPWIVRDLVAFQSSFDDVRGVLTGVAVGPNDHVWLTGQFPGDLRTATDDWGTGSFTVLRLERGASTVARYTRLPGGKAGLARAVPYGTSVLLVAGGRCSSSEGCVGSLSVGDDQSEVWEHSRLDSAMGAAGMSIMNLHSDGGEKSGRLVLRSGERRRVLRVRGWMHLDSAVVSAGRLVIFVTPKGAVRIGDVALPGVGAGQAVAVRFGPEWDVEEAAAMDARLNVHPYGSQFVAEADGKLRWPRRCAFSRAGVRFVTDDDIKELFAPP